MKILILSLRSFGDCIVTLEFIKYLSANTNMQIDIFTKNEFIKFFQNNQYVKNIYSTTFLLSIKRNSLYSLLNLFKKIAMLRKQKYDIVLNNIGDFREQIIGFLINSKMNVSIRFSKKHPFSNLIRKGFDLLVDKHVDIPNDMLNVYDMQKYIAENILQKKIILKKKSRADMPTKVAIHPIAGMKCRMWEYENWIDLIKKIYKDDRIIVFCAPNEKEHIKNTFSAVLDKIDIVGENVDIFLQKLECVKLFIGLDSFSIHAAYHKNVPLKVMLNGANNANIWMPPNTKVIEAKHECKFHPCYNIPKCAKKSFEYTCIKSIKVQDVLEAIRNE
ncbi:MAG: glycosyltransferase family 9 protein [Campylobacteraceae bacterium]|jgi:heptosyltransferase-3|nr:glycosyltransferase family 9 protein [Campylobacteraceae bacterium]